MNVIATSKNINNSANSKTCLNVYLLSHMKPIELAVITTASHIIPAATITGFDFLK